MAKFLVDAFSKLTWIVSGIAIILVIWGSRLPGANEYLIHHPFDFIFGLFYALDTLTINLFFFSELEWGQIFTLAAFGLALCCHLCMLYRQHLAGASKPIWLSSIAKLLIPLVILTFAWMLSICGIPQMASIKLSEKAFMDIAWKSQHIGQWFGCYKVSGTDIIDNQLFIYIDGAGFMDDSGSSDISCGFTKDESGNWVSKCIP